MSRPEDWGCVCYHSLAWRDRRRSCRRRHDAARPQPRLRGFRGLPPRCPCARRTRRCRHSSPTRIRRGHSITRTESNQAFNCPSSPTPCWAAQPGPWRRNDSEFRAQTPQLMKYSEQEFRCPQVRIMESRFPRQQSQCSSVVFDISTCAGEMGGLGCWLQCIRGRECGVCARVVVTMCVPLCVCVCVYACMWRTPAQLCVISLWVWEATLSCIKAHRSSARPENPGGQGSRPSHPTGCPTQCLLID